MKHLVTFGDHITESLGTATSSQHEERGGILLLENSSKHGTSIPIDDLPSQAPDKEEAILAMKKAIIQYRQKKCNQKEGKFRPSQIPLDTDSLSARKTDRGKDPICYKCY